MTTKRTIVRVCREWREIGIEFLYENVVVVRDHLDELVELFTTSGAVSDSTSTHGYGWWTKRIDCSIEIILSMDLILLCALLEQYHNVEIFSTPIANPADMDLSVLPEVSRLLQSRFSHSLRRFELSLSEADNLSMVPSLPLTCLSTVLGNVACNALHSSFSHITTLTLDIPYYIRQSPSQWTFPSLQTLSMLQMSNADTKLLHPFIARHQQTLVHIFLSMHSTDPFVLPALISDSSRLRSVTLDGVDLQRIGRRDKHKVPGPTYVGILNKPPGLNDVFWRDGLKRMLKSRIFPDLMVIRLLKETSPVPSVEGWRELVELCRARGIRFEDKDRKAIVLVS